ncbi:hypothetical protein D3C84_989360 [compost metagenome]
MGPAGPDRLAQQSSRGVSVMMPAVSPIHQVVKMTDCAASGAMPPRIRLLVPMPAPTVHISRAISTNLASANGEARSSPDFTQARRR